MLGPPSYPILAIMTALLSSSVLSTEWLECDPPKSLAIELENGKKLLVHDAQVNVTYNRDELAVYEYPGIDDVNILINNTVVSFSGHVLSENEQVVEGDADRVSKIFNSKIAGFAKLLKGRDNNNDLLRTLTDYSLYLSRNCKEAELELPKKVQVEIIHEAVSCVKSTLDGKIGNVTERDLDRARLHPYNFGSISAVSGDLDDLRSKSYRVSAEDAKLVLSNLTNLGLDHVGQHDALQRAINKIVDLAVAELATRMQRKNEGKIEIPDLSQNFSTGSSWWRTTGEFGAFDGTFEDLTTISRRGNVSLSRKGANFSASCGFALPVSRMNYRGYGLRYGVAKVSGKLSASFDGLSLLASGSVDFAERPCRAVLLDTRVVDLGKVKVKVTGLGPLKMLLSKLATWITKKWRDEIVVAVEDKLREIVARHLGAFDCEKYRLERAAF